MSYVWPHHLWLLALLPLLPVLYGWLLRRRARQPLRLSSVAVARAAHRAGWRRHVPPALLGLALALLMLALARPVASLTLPWARSTVMLAVDVSLSMRVADVEPTRMAAAQAAAKTFLRELPPQVDVGLVTFAGSAQVAQQATAEHGAVVRAIDAVQMQIGTAIGSAIVVCLSELFPDHGLDLGAMGSGGRRSGSSARSLDARGKPPPKAVEPVPPGSYESAVIILLSDGRRTMGVDTLEAARMAADRGVRIHVVGLGTPDGHLAEGEGMAMYLQLDEATLQQVARLTGGEYHHAATAEALRAVYQQLGTRWQVAARQTELAPLLALAAAALLLTGATLSLLWFGRTG